MVVCTRFAVAALATADDQLAASTAVIGIAAGSTATATGGTSAAIATATGTALAAGAIIGAVVADNGSAVFGAVEGAFIGGCSAAAVGGLGTGAGSLLAGTGGWGRLVLGTCQSSTDNNITYDCWKPVVHDTSKEPSEGMLLADLLRHKNVAKCSLTEGTVPGLPRITLENVWNESFEIEYVVLPDTGELASHAKRLPDNTLDF